MKSVQHNLGWIVLAALFLCGIILRAYHLSWGAPFYFHPDERNIAYVVAQMPSFPKVIFQGTFAYGNMLIILSVMGIRLVSPLFHFLHIIDPFAQAVLMLRFLSLLSSVAMLILIYLTGSLWSKKVGLLSLFFATFSVGFIQQAHFGTFDSFITLCAVSSCYFLFMYIKNNRFVFYLFALFSIALGASAKISLLVLLLPCSIILFFFRKHVGRTGVLAIAGALATLTVTIALSPYYVTSNFLSGIQYEQGVVSGTLPVFYTQSFTNTLPFLFQVLNIFPFLLNPVITVFFIVSLCFLIAATIRKPELKTILLLIFFFLLFVPQALLFSKWTRYMLPVLPFVYIIISLCAVSIYRKVPNIFHAEKLQERARLFLLGAGCIICLYSLIVALCYSTIFIQQDTRIAAATFAEKHIASSRTILTEPYDLGILPFNEVTQKILLFDFYSLDANPATIAQLTHALHQADFIVLPSQRLYRSRMLQPHIFPLGNMFYTGLFSGKLGFTQIYRTPCTAVCAMVYNDPVFSYEETASVFDKPTVFIFKKTRILSANEYEKILSQ